MLIGRLCVDLGRVPVSVGTGGGCLLTALVFGWYHSRPQELCTGRDATGLRHWYATADARRSRNDPCSCGSGAKGKRCHGAPTPRTTRSVPTVGD